jgi:glycosyltransferase involved in cell wall biosynthesis
MKISVDEISVVIPVKNNQKGINNFLNSIFDTHKGKLLPREIIIVDNMSDTPVLIPSHFTNQGLEIHLLECHKVGAASARNVGAMYASGNWLLFVDSDCIATETLLTGYLNVRSDAVAYAGFIDAIGTDYLSQYYVSQQIHLPPTIYHFNGEESPQYLVTANALVLKTAFIKVGGFNEEFIFAGGEDSDLALKLSKIGTLAFALDSVVLHDFNDGLIGFIKRFVRYGKGNRLLKSFHKINLFPLPSTAKKKGRIINNLLVILQWLFLLIGYLYMSLLIKWKKY